MHGYAHHDMGSYIVLSHVNKQRKFALHLTALIFSLPYMTEISVVIRQWT